jgi:hypothetical protein
MVTLIRNADLHGGGMTLNGLADQHHQVQTVDQELRQGIWRSSSSTLVDTSTLREKEVPPT